MGNISITEQRRRALLSRKSTVGAAMRPNIPEALVVAIPSSSLPVPDDEDCACISSCERARRRLLSTSAATGRARSHWQRAAFNTRGDWRERMIDPPTTSGPVGGSCCGSDRSWTFPTKRRRTKGARIG